MLTGPVARLAAYIWRTFRTGIGFGVFGLGALVIAAFFPLLAWLPGDRERRAQRVVHQTFRLWVWFATVLGLLRVRWHGRERLRGPSPCVVVANHPTLIDIVLLIACMPQADCVVKSAAWKNPFLRWVLRAAGYVRNDRGSALIDDCAARVAHGRWLVLFPEGTRSPLRRLGPFHRGAAHVALRAQAPLLPVVITCEPPTLMKGQKWYHVPNRTAQFTVQVGEPIAATELPSPAATALAARQLTGDIRTLFEERLQHAGA